MRRIAFVLCVGFCPSYCVAGGIIDATSGGPSLAPLPKILEMYRGEEFATWTQVFEGIRLADMALSALPEARQNFCSAYRTLVELSGRSDIMQNISRTGRADINVQMKELAAMDSEEYCRKHGF